MKFSDAIRALNAGKRLRRGHWPVNASISLLSLRGPDGKLGANLPNGSRVVWIPEAGDTEADDWDEAPEFDNRAFERRKYLLPEEL